MFASAVLLPLSVAAVSQMSQTGSMSGRPADSSLVRSVEEYKPIPEAGIDHGAMNANLAASNREVFFEGPPLCYDEYPPAQDFWLDRSNRLCANIQATPFVEVFDNGEFITLWEDHRGGMRYYFQRFDSDGTPRDCNRIIPMSDLGSLLGAADGRTVFAADAEGNFAVTAVKTYGQIILVQRIGQDDVPLDTVTIVNDDSFGVRYNPSIAMAPDGRFVIVWEDERNSPHDDIYGQLFDSLGAPVGANFQINDDTTSCDQWTAAVAMNDSGEFVVVWQDGRNDSIDGDPPFNDSTDIYLQRFASDGQAIGANIKVNDSGTATLFNYPDIEYGPDRGFMVLWEDQRTGSWQTYAQRFDASGQKIGPNMHLMLSPESIYPYAPRLAMRENGEFALIYVAQNEYLAYLQRVHLQRFDSTGSPLGAGVSVSPIDSLSRDESEPAIAVGPDQGEIAIWRDERFGSAGDIMVQRFNANLQPMGENLMVNVDDADQWWPNAGGNGAGYNVAVWWQEYRDTISYFLTDDIFAQRFLDDQFEGSRIQITTRAYPAPIAVAVNDEGTSAISWIQYASPSYRPYIRFMDLFGVPGDSIYRVDTYTGDSSNYDTWLLVGAAAGDRFLIAWTDFREDNYDVYGRIFGSDGTPIGDDFRIDDGPDLSSQFSGGACGLSNGSFYVVWKDGRTDNPGIYLRQLDSLGNPLTDGIRISSVNATQLRPYIATQSANACIVVWFDSRDGDRAVYGQMVDQDGHVIGSNFRIGSAPNTLYDLDFAHAAMKDDGRSLVLWRCPESVGDSDAICSCLLDSTGAILENNLRVSDSMFDDRQQYAGAIAPASDGFFAVWMDSRRDMGWWDIFGRFLDMVPVDVTNEPDIEAMPQVYALGQNYPNPFNPATTITFALPKRSQVKLDVINVLGQEVRTLVDEQLPAGEHSVVWDGTDSKGRQVSSGVYFYRLHAGEMTETRQMILLK